MGSAGGVAVGVLSVAGADKPYLCHCQAAGFDRQLHLVHLKTRDGHDLGLVRCKMYRYFRRNGAT
jgi:hypothetical protein